MSALPSAAVSRHFIFDARKAPQSLLDRLSDFPKLSGVAPASRLEVQPAPEMVTSGIREVDALTGGFPRGCLTEICGPASSGRTTLLLAALAAATERGEVGALIDAGDTLDPLSAAAAGIDLDKLLWVRCGEKKRSTDKFFRTSSGTSARASQSPRRSPDYSVLDQVLRITDLLLQSNGFGLIALDLGDISTRAARRIPLASWFRFRRAIETTSTVMLVIEQQPIAGSCSSLLLRLQDHKPSAARALSSHCRLFEALRITLELERTRLERKPPRNMQTILRTQPAWAVS